MSISEVLISARSSDSNARNSANKWIETQKSQNPQQLLVSLSVELGNESSSPPTRQLAGILIKNIVSNANAQQQLEGLWQSIDQPTKQKIRENCLGSLAATDKSVRTSAAQAVASLASLDIPQGEWPQVLEILIQNSTNENLVFRSSALKCLGFICEQLPKEVISKELSNRVLSVIAHNLTLSNDLEILEIALMALRNSLSFNEEVFKNQVERAYLMGVLFQCMESTQPSIKKETLQIFCDIADLFYDQVGHNLIELGSLTYKVIEHEESSVAILAVEFWNIIADTERSKIEFGESTNGYINTAVATLVPMLLSKIHLHEELDQEDWSLDKSIASTLDSVSRVVGDQLVDLCASYINQQIFSSDFKVRNGVMLVIGSILEGASSAKATLLLQECFGEVLKGMSESDAYLKTNSAWVLSRICSLQYNSLQNVAKIKEVLEFAIAGIEDEKIASHCSWCIINIAEKCNYQQVFDLSLFKNTIDFLCVKAFSASTYDSKLQVAMYSAVNTLIENCSEEFMECVLQKLDEFVKALGVLKPWDKSLPNIYSSLHAAFGKCQPKKIPLATADNFMAETLRIFNARQNIIEEAMDATGCIAENLGEGFLKYLEGFMPYVIWALNAKDSFSVCKAGTMCLGDLARAIGDHLSKYMDELIPSIVLNLELQTINTRIKITTIETLSDIASNAIKSFLNYLGRILPYIESAANASLVKVDKEEDPDMFELIESLRNSVIDFYANLVEGLGDIKNQDVILGHIEGVVKFCLICTQDFTCNLETTANLTLGLIGDIAAIYKGKIRELYNTYNLENFVRHYRDFEKTSELANYALSQILASIN